MADPSSIHEVATASLSIAAGALTVLGAGWLGYQLLAGAGPYAQDGEWRRNQRGDAVCPLCADVPDPEGASPLLPVGEGKPVEAREKCCSCLAYRAEEITNG